MHRIAGWWDGLELWITGLPFIPQFILVMAVVLPLSFGIAWLLDRGLIVALKALGRGSDPDSLRIDSDPTESVS